MNVFIPGWKPTVQDPKNDVRALPEELMSKMPEKTNTTVPGGVPEANMSRMPDARGGIPGVNMSAAPAPQKPAPFTPIVDPIGRNITGVPQPLTPIQKKTAQEMPRVEVPAPIQQGVAGDREPTEEDYQAASDYFDTITLSQEEMDFIDQSVNEGYEFKDAMLYIANKRQNEQSVDWDEPVQEEKKGGFLNTLSELLRINESTGKLLPEDDDSEVTRFAKPIINDLTSAAKFVANLPADTVEFSGQLLDMAMNPWQTTKGLMGLLGAVGQGATETAIAAFSPKTQEEVSADLIKKAKAVTQDEKAGGISKYFAKKFLQNEAVMQAIAQEIVNNFGTEEKFRQTLVENPLDVILTIVPIGQSLRGMKVADTAGKTGKAAEYAQFVKGLQEAKSSINIMKPAWLESRASAKLGGKKIPRSDAGLRISIVNKIGEMTGNPELAAKTFADLDNAEIGAIKNIGPAKVQEMIDDLNQIDEAALAGEGRGNIYNKLNVEVMEGIGKRSKELSELEKVRKQIVKDTDAPFTKAEMQSIFDEAISKQGITRKNGDKGSEYNITGEGSIKASELGKLDDLEREIFRTDKDTYTAEEIDLRIKNLQKNLYDKQGMPKNGSESVTKMTEGIIAKLNERYKEKMPPEYAEAKEKMSQILTDRKKILKELKEEDNTIALGRDIDKMDEAELGKLMEDSIAGNRMALFLRRLASNTTTGGDPQSLAEIVKRFTGIDVENRAIALRALAKATGKTQIVNELGGLFASNQGPLGKALGIAKKVVNPSGEKTIKELASRGEERKIPYEPKTVKYEGKVVEKPTENKYVKTRMEVNEKPPVPFKPDYDRAKGMVERPGAKTDLRAPSNIMAGRSDRRAVIATPRGGIKALPPAKPAWVQQMDGQYTDPHGYIKAIERDILKGEIKLKEVDNFGETTSTDELNYILNHRPEISTKESLYDAVLDRDFIKNDVGFTKLLDDVYKKQNGEIARYFMGDADYKAMTAPVQIDSVRNFFGEAYADDLIAGVRYMEKHGYEDISGIKGKKGTKNKALEAFVDAVDNFNLSRNPTGSASLDLTPDEAYNIIKEMIWDAQQKNKKFQTLAERYEVAPEISVAQAREIMGKDFPIKIVDKLQTPEGRKAMGMYYQGAIEIAKNPVSTTGYHEAFHAWLEIYGPSRLRDAAFKQIERTTGLVNKIDIEEHLAESFAMWKLSARGTSGALKQFFQAIWEDIKSLIGKQDKVTDLFRNVGKKGRMNELSKNRMLQDISYESPNGITTKVLEELQGRTSVSKQFIENLLKRDDVRQVEKDIFAEKLRNFGEKVDIGELSDQIRAELLPLKASSTKNVTKYGPGEKDFMSPRKAKYEYVSLPDEIRGKVQKYYENIYNSPVKTEAGNIHFRDAHPLEKGGYFGHTRIEDMADGETRRVIEVQSDLYQKGNLEKERIGETRLDALTGNRTTSPADLSRQKEVDKLAQYNDPTAHFRMVREEIATAAKDGKTKLQFPTGETAMRVEGLGSGEDMWDILPADKTFDDLSTANAGPVLPILRPDNIKVGQKISRENYVPESTEWYVTEVMENGKFKAIDKEIIESDLTDLIDMDRYDSIEHLIHEEPALLRGRSETFDISGKVDTQNPIYKFYENEMQKYLKRFGAQRVTDDKGVEWFEVPIKEEYGKRPVQAFQSETIKHASTPATQTQATKKIIDDAKKHTEEGFIEKYNAYPDGENTKSPPAHAYVEIKDIYPGEWDNWMEVEKMKGSVERIDKMAKNFDVNKLDPILVRKYPDSAKFAVEDGHHRMAAIIKASLMHGKPFAVDGKIPVYFDADTLKKIWKIQNNKAPENKTYEILKKDIQKMIGITSK